MAVTSKGWAWTPFAELTDEQRAMVTSDAEDDRLSAALQGWGLDVLAEDEGWLVREYVVMYGYIREGILEKEKHNRVLQTLAYQGYFPEELSDPSRHVNVRMAVAKRGEMLEKLATDPAESVRDEVKKHDPAAQTAEGELPEVEGEPAFDDAVRDFETTIRSTKEENLYVKRAVRWIQETEGLTYRQIAEKAGIPKSQLDYIMRDRRLSTQDAAAIVKAFPNSIGPEWRARIFETAKYWESFEAGTKRAERPDTAALSAEKEMRRQEEEFGFVRFERLDKEKQGYVKSRDVEKREHAAEKGWGYDRLAKDKDYRVRAAVASSGYNAFDFASDTSSTVRAEVAEKGWCLNVLASDDVERVRDAAQRYLARSGETLEKWEEEHPDRVADAKKTAEDRAEKKAAAEEKAREPYWKTRAKKAKPQEKGPMTAKERRNRGKSGEVRTSTMPVPAGEKNRPSVREDAKRAQNTASQTGRGRRSEKLRKNTYWNRGY